MVKRITFASVIALLLAYIGISSPLPGKQKAANSDHGSAAYGKITYESHCAVCHGKDAKGGGPANAYLNVQPPDLTRLAKRHDGKFPDEYVATVLRLGVSVPAHGSVDMPVWGPVFQADAGFSQAGVNVRIADLIAYLKSLQSE